MSFELFPAKKCGKRKTDSTSIFAYTDFLLILLINKDIDKCAILSMTGMSHFTLVDLDEAKRSVQKSKDFSSIESKETYWPHESVVENDIFLKEGPMRSESQRNASKYYTNSLIRFRAENNGDSEKNIHCLNYCKFSLCK